MSFTSVHPQLPLGLEPGELFNFDTFVEGDNTLVTAVLRQCALGVGETQVYIWSEGALGKTHLLQACGHLAARHQRTVCYLTATQIQQNSIEIFDGLEQLQLVCLDELDCWLNSPAWQEALFDLINRLRERGSSLVMASSYSPDASGIQLADLRSRLSWGPVFQLKTLSDQDKVLALRARARQSGLELAENVVDYLLRRYPRDLADQFRRLEILDKAAMSMQRSVTIPLIKTVFPEN